MLRRSRRSAKRSTTSRRTSRASLAALIAELPPDRAAAVFTHSSWASDRSQSYERLEFLGDSVLELAIAHALYDRFPEYEEGQMAKLRSQVVSRASCAVIADQLGLGHRLLEQHPGPESTEAARLATNRNVLAALLEAALAAIYLEHGFEAVAGPIVEAFSPQIEYALTHKVDYKTELQEELARRGRAVSYTLLDSEGPAHERTFTAAAMIDGVQEGVGKGGSKKDAEQEAAREALEGLIGEGAGTPPGSGRSA
jgi:ribonuclease III